MDKNLLLQDTNSLTFIGPCIVIRVHFYNKPNQIHQYLKFILFCNNSTRFGLSVHHQEFVTVHTATGIQVCQTDTAICLLASRQQEFKNVYTATGIFQTDTATAC